MIAGEVACHQLLLGIGTDMTGVNVELANREKAGEFLFSCHGRKTGVLDLPKN